MRRLPKMAAALLAAALAVSAALPALAADQRAELELEASVRCTGEAADETLTVRLTALDGAPMPEGCDDEAELDFPARDCRAADDKTLTKTFDTIVYTAPGIYEYTDTQDAGGRQRADYDDTVFYLKVMVAWDTDGELKGHVSVRRDGDDGAKAELLFRNGCVLRSCCILRSSLLVVGCSFCRLVSISRLLVSLSLCIFRHLGFNLGLYCLMFSDGCCSGFSDGLEFSLASSAAVFREVGKYL